MITFHHECELVGDHRLNKVVKVTRVDASVGLCGPLHVQTIALHMQWQTFIIKLTNTLNWLLIVCH